LTQEETDAEVTAVRSSTQASAMNENTPHEIDDVSHATISRLERDEISRNQKEKKSLIF